MSLLNQRGASLVEILVVAISASILMLGLASLFVTERYFWRMGNQQVEAQQSAHTVIERMARIARNSSSYSIAGEGSGSEAITFAGGCGAVFQGGPNFNGGQFQMDDCVSPAVTLIDGQTVTVTNFDLTAINTELVQINLSVAWGASGSEDLETHLLLRNAS